MGGQDNVILSSVELPSSWQGSDTSNSSFLIVEVHKHGVMEREVVWSNICTTLRRYHSEISFPVNTAAEHQQTVQISSSLMLLDPKHKQMQEVGVWEPWLKWGKKSEEEGHRLMGYVRSGLQKKRRFAPYRSKNLQSSGNKGRYEMQERFWVWCLLWLNRPEMEPKPHVWEGFVLLQQF